MGKPDFYDDCLSFSSLASAERALVEILIEEAPRYRRHFDPRPPWEPMTEGQWVVAQCTTPGPSGRFYICPPETVAAWMDEARRRSRVGEPFE